MFTDNDINQLRNSKINDKDIIGKEKVHLVNVGLRGIKQALKLLD